MAVIKDIFIDRIGITAPKNRGFQFEKSEIADPEKSDGRMGVVSAIVLADGDPSVIVPVANELVLRVIGSLATAAIQPTGGAIAGDFQLASDTL